MKKLNDEERKNMREIFEKNGLTNNDVFAHKHYVIITRTGIEKIQANNGIQVEYEVVRMDRDFVVLKAKAMMEEGAVYVETFGEAGPENCRNAYYVATAEKRALSRAVLKCIGLYKHSVFGEDEDVQNSEE
jgi:hypothetical protein